MRSSSRERRSVTDRAVHELMRPPLLSTAHGRLWRQHVISCTRPFQASANYGIRKVEAGDFLWNFTLSIAAWGQDLHPLLHQRTDLRGSPPARSMLCADCRSWPHRPRSYHSAMPGRASILLPAPIAPPRRWYGQRSKMDGYTASTWVSLACGQFIFAWSAIFPCPMHRRIRQKTSSHVLACPSRDGIGKRTSSGSAPVPKVHRARLDPPFIGWKGSRTGRHRRMIGASAARPGSRSIRFRMTFPAE